MGLALRAAYGVPDPTASHGGPFSYKTYLSKLLEKTFWGDEVVLWSISMMWGLKIIVVNSKTLRSTGFVMMWPCDMLTLGWSLMPVLTILWLVSQVPGRLLNLLIVIVGSLVQLLEIHLYNYTGNTCTFFVESVKRLGHLHYIVFKYLVTCWTSMVACIFSLSKRSCQRCYHLLGCPHVSIQAEVPG